MVRSTPSPGHVIVQDNRTGKVSYWQKEYHQSAGDARGVSTADYIHAMYFFLRQAKCKDVLMIGCGGGTLATMLHAKGVKVTIVDIHKLSFDIARDYFHLPADIPCHVADGIAYLKMHRRRHDAIVLDAFGEGGMPGKFMEPAFFRLAKSRLKQRASMFLMNVIVADDDDATPDDLIRTMRAQWSKVRLLDTDGWVDRNAVIAAGAVAKLKKPYVLMPPRPGGAKLKRELAVLDWRTIR
ncbi:MAG TPA: fused MFS/spermidine synthase [Rhizomicrobium sp.]|nr:fused MFS/spermidine synthase [Rhizomicrobium sp.]